MLTKFTNYLNAKFGETSKSNKGHNTSDMFYKLTWNKRAQRALGRSPEEKVKVKPLYVYNQILVENF